MELLQMFYGGEPFSFCLPDEGQIYGVTRQCHSRVSFQKHTQTTNRWVVPDVFRFCRLPSGRQSAGVHSWCGLTLSAASEPHALHLDLESEPGFQNTVLYQKSLCVENHENQKRFPQWPWPARRWLSTEDVSSLAFRLIWSLTDDTKTTLETDRFSNSMLLLPSKAMDDSLAPCGCLHYLKNVWWRCCWKTQKLGMMICNLIFARCNSAYQTL